MGGWRPSPFAYIIRIHSILVAGWNGDPFAIPKQPELFSVEKNLSKLYYFVVFWLQKNRNSAKFFAHTSAGWSGGRSEMTYATQHINETNPVRVGAFIDRGLLVPVGFDVNHILRRLPM